MPHFDLKVHLKFHASESSTYQNGHICREDSIALHVQITRREKEYINGRSEILIAGNAVDLPMRSERVCGERERQEVPLSNCTGRSNKFRIICA